MPFDASAPYEVEMRAPILWLDSITNPTFVIEGTAGPGNFTSLKTLSKSSRNPLVRFVPVRGANHFTVLAPTNELIASKMLRDDGPATNLAISQDEVDRPFARRP